MESARHPMSNSPLYYHCRSIRQIHPMSYYSLVQTVYPLQVSYFQLSKKLPALEVGMVDVKYQMVEEKLHEEAVEFTKEAAYLFPETADFLHYYAGHCRI